MFIYSFHMPAFVLISGMLTKSIFGNEEILKLTKSILIPFIVFTLLYELFNLLMTGHVSSYTRHLQPYWILWYLFSLFIWRMSLPIIINFKYPVFISLMISIAAGYFDSIGYFLGLSRTIYFFPFFIIGYILTPQSLMKIKEYFINSRNGFIILIGILVSSIIFFSIFNEMKHQWLYGSYSYYKLGKSFLIGSGIRAILYSISIVTVFSIFLLIPDKKLKIFSGGNNSLQVYVWHGFFIKLLSISGVIYMVGEYPDYLILMITFLFSLVLTKLLASDFVSLSTKMFIIKPSERILLNQKKVKS